MANCLKCNKDMGGKKGVSICPDCTDAIYDALPTDIQFAMAKVGLYALIDEATGYEKIRPKDDLKQVLEKAKREARNG